jgi:hypothetical protein
MAALEVWLSAKVNRWRSSSPPAVVRRGMLQSQISQTVKFH